MRLRRSLTVAAWSLCALFALASVLFYAKTRERGRLLDTFIDEALAGVDRADTDAVVHALALAVYTRTNRGVPPAELPLYERLEATSFFNVTTGVSLKTGAYGVIGGRQFGPCGTMSRVLLNALWELGIPARKLQLLPAPGSDHIVHTMVEYRVGDRWQVISPSDSAFTWRNARGQVATVEEIRSDPAIFHQVDHGGPGFPAADFSNTANIRWEKLPPALRRVARAVLGERRYATMETPRLYEQPRRVFLIGSLMLTGLSALAALLLSRPARRAHAR